MCWKIAGILVFVSVLVQVHSLAKCNSNISEYIKKNSVCPNQLIQTVSMRSWNYVRMSAGDIPTGAKCVKQFFDPQGDGCKSARTITYFTDSKTSQQVEDCEVEEKECGYVIESKSNNRKFEIKFFVVSDKVAGYYRCGDSDTNGHDQGACLVPCGTKLDDTQVSTDVIKCETMLKDAGIKDIVPVNVCSSLIY